LSSADEQATAAASSPVQDRNLTAWQAMPRRAAPCPLQPQGKIRGNARPDVPENSATRYMPGLSAASVTEN